MGHSEGNCISTAPQSQAHIAGYQPEPRPCHRTAHRPKGLSCRYHRDLIVCAKALPARMTAGLSHGMPGHGAGICSGPISGSMMQNAGSTPSRSGGGARTATRSWMICAEFSTGYVSYHCPGINPPSKPLSDVHLMPDCPARQARPAGGKMAALFISAHRKE